MQTQQQHHLHSDSDLINFHSSTLFFNIHLLEQYDTSVFLGSFVLCWNPFENSRAGRSLSQGATQQCPLEIKLPELTVHWHCYLIFPTSASMKERITGQIFIILYLGCLTLVQTGPVNCTWFVSYQTIKKIEHDGATTAPMWHCIDIQKINQFDDSATKSSHFTVEFSL